MSSTSPKSIDPSWSDATRIRLFVALWCVAHLGHLLRKGIANDPFVYLLLIATLVLLQRPLATGRLVVFALLQIVYLAMLMPATDNHLFIMGFVNLTVLCGMVPALLRRIRDPRYRPILHPVAEAAAPIRVALLLAYGAAALAKLNAGFFDTDVSCAVSMYRGALTAVGIHGPILPDGLLWTMPVFVAGAELLIPLLLFSRRLRGPGICVVVAFHLLISFSPTATALDFTIMLFALMVLFLSPAQVEHMVARLHRLWAHLPAPDLLRQSGLLAAGICCAVLIGGDRTNILSVMGNRNWIILAPVAVGLGILLVDAVLSQRKRNTHDRSRGLALGHPIQCLPLALILVTAASPYIGGKTISVFTMYSNLQTERGESNHFLFPRLPGETAQDDLVRIVETCQPDLERMASDGRLVSFHEMRRRLATMPNACITYERGGVTHAHSHAHEDPNLIRRPRLLNWWLAHRAFDPENRCQW